MIQYQKIGYLLLEKYLKIFFWKLFFSLVFSILLLYLYFFQRLNESREVTVDPIPLEDFDVIRFFFFFLFLFNFFLFLFVLSCIYIFFSEAEWDSRSHGRSDSFRRRWCNSFRPRSGIPGRIRRRIWYGSSILFRTKCNQ